VVLSGRTGDSDGVLVCDVFDLRENPRQPFYTQCPVHGVVSHIATGTGYVRHRTDTGGESAESPVADNSVNAREFDMNQLSQVRRLRKPLVGAALAGVLAALGACASTPPAPESALDAAKVAITNAEKADANRYAGAELGEAREKLAQAGGAVQQEQMILAEQLAQQSRVQAELASARTGAAKAAEVNAEMARGAAALKEEMQRAGEPR
jgi:hypothetical protein